LASFFSELKQRRIVQIVASYAVSGWVALQVIGELVERGILPDIVYMLGFVLFVGGLGASSVLGWYHGEKGHQEATRFEISLLAVVALTTVFFGYRTIESARAEAAIAAGSSGSLELERIGVLYFSDLSRTHDLAYLADGLTESLIDRLADVSGLDVISESGSARFRDSDLPLDSVAAILSAGTLVQGSVEPRGDGVRVSVVLVDGESGAELQRQTVEESAEDVFDLQDELAERVVDLLRAWLGTEVNLRRARRGTEDVAAWATYQRGMRARRESEQRIRAGDVEGFISEFQRADSLFEAAAEIDDDWPEPLVMRARLAYRWGELSREEPVEAKESLDLAVRRADMVLAAQPRHAMAYYTRGLARYMMWSQGLAADPSESERLFQAALDDLEKSTEIDPKLAPGWSVLSILYSQVPDIVGANLAARRALEADEFLSSARSVLLMLYQTSYDLENFRDAIQYCDEGRERFPQIPEFTECQLWLMGTRAVDPDPVRAWQILEDYLEMVPESDRERAGISSRLLVALVLARADLADSALAVVAKSQAPPEIDPTRELLGYEALVHLQLGDPTTAIDRLRTYLTASPEHRAGWQWSSHWWWRELQGNPDFQRVMGR
jgi:eukaryotic-like serine/threonine-protein kinase